MEGKRRTAPGSKRILFSPVEDSTRMMATPVVFSGTVWIPLVSMPSAERPAMRGGPKVSAPTAPIIFTVMESSFVVFGGFGRERRAAATASLGGCVSVCLMDWGGIR